MTHAYTFRRHSFSTRENRMILRGMEMNNTPGNQPRPTFEEYRQDNRLDQYVVKTRENLQNRVRVLEEKLSKPENKEYARKIKNYVNGEFHDWLQQYARREINDSVQLENGLRKVEDAIAKMEKDAIAEAGGKTDGILIDGKTYAEHQLDFAHSDALNNGIESLEFANGYQVMDVPEDWKFQIDGLVEINKTDPTHSPYSQDISASRKRFVFRGKIGDRVVVTFQDGTRQELRLTSGIKDPKALRIDFPKKKKERPAPVPDVPKIEVKPVSQETVEPKPEQVKSEPDVEIPFPEFEPEPFPDHVMKPEIKQQPFPEHVARKPESSTETEETPPVTINDITNVEEPRNKPVFAESVRKADTSDTSEDKDAGKSEEKKTETTEPDAKSDTPSEKKPDEAAEETQPKPKLATEEVRTAPAEENNVRPEADTKKGTSEPTSKNKVEGHRYEEVPVSTDPFDVYLPEVPDVKNVYEDAERAVLHYQSTLASTKESSSREASQLQLNAAVRTLEKSLEKLRISDVQTAMDNKLKSMETALDNMEKDMQHEPKDKRSEMYSQMIERYTNATDQMNKKLSTLFSAYNFLSYHLPDLKKTVKRKDITWTMKLAGMDEYRIMSEEDPNRALYMKERDAYSQYRQSLRKRANQTVDSLKDRIKYLRYTN